MINLAQQSNLLETLCLHIINSKSKIVEEHQRQRLIFGICEILLLKNKPNEILTKVPEFFNLAITLVERNCEVRLDEEDDENYQTESDEDD